MTVFNLDKIILRSGNLLQFFLDKYSVTATNRPLKLVNVLELKSSFSMNESLFPQMTLLANAPLIMSSPTQLSLQYRVYILRGEFDPSLIDVLKYLDDIFAFNFCYNA